MQRHVQRWPLPIALGVYGFVIAVIYTINSRITQGQFTYALDDPYIHMAMARNFSQYGIWGVTRYGFSASSSSPLWTLLLAGLFRLFPASLLLPFVLNILISLLLLTVSALFLFKVRLQGWVALLALLALTFAIPLPALTFVGMEHGLHSLLTLLFVILAARQLANPASATPQANLLLLLLALLSTATRYESLFMVAIAALALAVRRRRWRMALALAASGALPMLVAGLISLAHGWYFLPTSILVKAQFPTAHSLSGILYSLGYRALETLYNAPALLFLLLATLGLAVYHRWRQPSPWSGVIASMSALFAPMLLLHLQFARLGWFYRYEAYLIALGGLIVAAGTGTLLPQQLPKKFILTPTRWPLWLATALLAVVVSTPFLVRAARSLATTPLAVRDIYQQQVQMAEFIQRYYNTAPIVANDIGAIAYYSQSHLLDLWGLGSLETASCIIDHTMTPEITAELAEQKHARVALIYDNDHMPAGWVKVGEWTLNSPTVVESTVSIFATDPQETGPLVAHLRAFARELPADVQQAGLYTQATP